jgi:acetyl esterase/lipase
VLRDEGRAFGRKLAAAGVTVTSVRYNGTIHDFMLLNPIANTPAGVSTGADCFAPADPLICGDIPVRIRVN